MKKQRWIVACGVLVATVCVLQGLGCGTDSNAPTDAAQGTSDAGPLDDAVTPLVDTGAPDGTPSADGGSDATTFPLYAVGYAHLSGMDTRVASVTFDAKGNILGYRAPLDSLERVDAAIAEPFNDSFVHAARMAEGSIRLVVNDAGDDETLPATAGQHVAVIRVNAPGLPASGQASYSLIHATKTSRPFGGGLGTGEVLSGQLQVNFGGPSGTRAGLSLSIAFGTGAIQVTGNGGANAPGTAGTSRFMGDGGTWLVEVPGTANGSGCDGGTCINAFAYVLFAGANAERAIVVYQFRDHATNSAPGFKPSGVAVFAKQ
ncbi:MAG: hypothetical protein U0174_25660 [Polyangiaceae bacterium]